MVPECILVTGGSGLVGSALKHLLTTRHSTSDLVITLPEYQAATYEDFSTINHDKNVWIFLSSQDGDLTSHTETWDVFSNVYPTVVLHLAAEVGGVFANISANKLFWQKNVAINENVLKLADEFEIKKCVSCLSTCIFPDKYPLTEDMIYLGPPRTSNMGYAYAKRTLDTANQVYNVSSDTLFTSIIPTNIFGPHDNYNLATAHVVPALIHKAYLAKQAGGALKIAGTGAPLRQFIYSHDLAVLIKWAVESYDERTPIILGDDEENEISIKEVAMNIADAFNLGRVECDVSLADGQYKKTASNSKLRRYLPDFKFTEFNMAVKETVSWFCENYESCRK